MRKVPPPPPPPKKVPPPPPPPPPSLLPSQSIPVVSISELNDEDLLPPPPHGEDNLDSPPPEIEDELLGDPEDDDLPPPDGDLDSLPSLDSNDDQFFCDLDDLEDPEFDMAYGDVLDEDFQSDPEESDPEPDPESEPEEDPPSSDEEDNNKKGSDEPPVVTLETHPIYSKYFKMLGVGLPRELVCSKMNQDGLDPSILDLDPHAVLSDGMLMSSSLAKRRVKSQKVSKTDIEEEIMRGGAGGIRAKGGAESKTDDVEKVAASEHPVYSKYFKMLKVGLPRHMVEAKCKQEGVDPKILDYDANQLVPITELLSYTAAESPAVPAVRAPRVSQVRKKKLFLTAVKKNSEAAGSLWEGDEVNLTLDDEEFNRLFTEEVGGNMKSRGQILEEQQQESKLKKIKGINLIDLKRAQNAAIALARIKLSYEEMREKVKVFDEEVFTFEQCKALLEFLPTDEEALILRRYTGDVNALGLAEKYMLTMMELVGVKPRLHALVVKRQFLPRWQDCKHKYGILESACDNIKISMRLKKVLKTILKVVNQLNDEQQHGITVESLVKLATIKAFDKKTSVLQYCIMLIYRHDEDALHFPEDLKHLADAAKLGLDAINSEKASIQSELTSSLTTLKNLKDHRCTDDEHLAEMIVTLESNLLPMCSELDKRAQTLQSKFKSILNYFCEDSKLSCQEFFIPLHKFVEDFIQTKSVIERQRQAEMRKQKAQILPSMPKRRISIKKNNI